MTERNDLPTEFSLTEEQRGEIMKLAEALKDKCMEFEAPFMIAICLGRNSEGVEVAESNYFNGERTPTTMVIARTIVDRNISNLMQLLALMASK